MPENVCDFCQKQFGEEAAFRGPVINFHPDCYEQAIYTYLVADFKCPNCKTPLKERGSLGSRGDCTTCSYSYDRGV